MLLGTIVTSLYDKKSVFGWWGNIKIQAKFLIPPHLITNYDIQQYYQADNKFNCIYSRNNVLKIKDVENVTNLH